jgi:hypothetical protein
LRERERREPSIYPVQSPCRLTALPRDTPCLVDILPIHLNPLLPLAEHAGPPFLPTWIGARQRFSHFGCRLAEEEFPVEIFEKTNVLDDTVGDGTCETGWQTEGWDFESMILASRRCEEWMSEDIRDLKRGCGGSVTMPHTMQDGKGSGVDLDSRSCDAWGLSRAYLRRPRAHLLERDGSVEARKVAAEEQCVL